MEAAKEDDTGQKPNLKWKKTEEAKQSVNDEHNDADETKIMAIITNTNNNDNQAWPLEFFKTPAQSS